MKLALASDLHFEFYNDPNWLPPLAGIVTNDTPDILVLAGDIGIGEGVIEAIERIAAALPCTQILWVAGNHEYFHQNYDDTLEKFRGAFQSSDRIHFLERGAIEINGWPLSRLYSLDRFLMVCSALNLSASWTARASASPITT